MRKILAFDSVNNNCSVAVSQGQKILSFALFDKPSRQAEALIPMIETALKDADLSYSDLDYIVSTNGPGSFTGIRIGLASARGLALASGKKAITVTNFELSFYRALEQVKYCKKIYVLINAYRNQLYVQEFTIDADLNSEVLLSIELSIDNRDKIILNSSFKAHEPTLLDNTKVVTILQNDNSNSIVVGSGLAVIYPEIRDLDNLKFLPRFPVVTARHLCLYADLKIRGGYETFAPPLYIRPPDAKLPSTLYKLL